MQDPQYRSTTELSHPSTAGGDWAALVAQAETFARQAQFEKALDVLNAAIAGSPKAAAPWQAKASVLFNLNRVEEALETLDTALEKVGEEPSLLRSKARFLRVE